MDLIAFGSTTGQPENRRTTVPVRSVTSARVLSILEFLALLPPAGVAASERGVGWLWVLFAAVIATLLWQRIFAEVRRRPFIPDGIIAAIACSIVLPASAPLWQVALALSFGIVVGQEIFGGRGRNFLNPAMVALAFFMFSFPGRPLEVLTPAIGLSVIPGALLLLAGGLISWRIVVGAAVGLLLISLIITADLPPVAASPTCFLFGLVYFAADPVAAASTNPGRWIYGILFGGAVAFLAGAVTPTMETAVSAALIAGILAPLIDSCVLALNSYQRGRRHG